MPDPERPDIVVVWGDDTGQQPHEGEPLCAA